MNYNRFCGGEKMLGEKLYTVADVASVTGLTSRTIRNYLKDGTLTGAKVGVQWRFTEEEVRRLFMRQAPGQQTPMQMIRTFAGGRGDENGYSDVSDTSIYGLSVYDIAIADEGAADKLFGEIIDYLEIHEVREVSLTHEFRTQEGVLRIAATGSLEGLEALIKGLKELG